MVPKGPAAAAVKRPLVIKPFKSAPQVVVEDLGEATWRRLHAALAAVAARSPVEVSKEELCQVSRQKDSQTGRYSPGFDFYFMRAD